MRNSSYPHIKVSLSLFRSFSHSFSFFPLFLHLSIHKYSFIYTYKFSFYLKMCGIVCTRVYMCDYIFVYIHNYRNIKLYFREYFAIIAQKLYHIKAKPFNGINETGVKTLKCGSQKTDHYSVTLKSSITLSIVFRIVNEH